MSDLELIADLIREQHGTEISSKDLQEIQLFLWEQNQQRKLGLIEAGHPDYNDYVTADLGKVIGFIVGAILGAFLLPGLGIVAGWVVGALVGGAIGVKLASVFDGPTKLEPTKASVKSVSDPVFGFSGVGGLVTLNAPIPKIYGNRDLNLDGGVKYRDPPKIYTRIYSKQGVRYLEGISILAFGILGRVAANALELDDKPRNDWFEEDILVWSSSGNAEQELNPLLSIPVFSQAVAISTNCYVGIYPSLSIDSVTGASVSTIAGVSDSGIQTVPMQNAVNAAVVGSGFEATSDNWSAGARSQLFYAGGAAGSYIYVQTTGTRSFNWLGSYRVAISITPSAANTLVGILGIAQSTGEFSLEADSKLQNDSGNPNGSWILRKGNGEIARGLVLQPDITRLEISLRLTNEVNNQQSIQVSSNGAILYEASIAGAYPDYYYAGYYAGETYTGVTNCATRVYKTASSATPTPTPTPTPQGFADTFTVSPQSIGKLTSGQIYRGESTGDLFVVSRNLVTNQVRFSRSFYFAALDRVYRAHITTSKKVNRIDLTIKAAIFARSSTGELVEHAEAFSISISIASQTKSRTVTGLQLSPEGDYRCGHFAIKSKSEQPTIHTLSIEGLPLDFYQVTVNPLKENQLIAPVRYLTLANILLLVAQPEQAAIGGHQIGVGAEVIDADLGELRGLMLLTAKPQVSAESGPTIQITHMNEIVYDGSDRTRYHGYTQGYSQLIASERLQSAPAETWDIELGAVIPNYVFASKTAITIENRGDVVGFQTAFPQGLIQRGDIVRISGTKWTRVITDLITPELQTSVYCIDRQVTIDTVAGSSIATFPIADEYNWAREGMPFTCSQLPSDAFLAHKLGNNKVAIASEFGERRNVATTGSFSAILNWQFAQTSGLDAVVYRMGSSNYFPDVYVDRLINPIDGLGNLVDRDYFIDYASIVKARNFCVRNNFYFDGVVTEGSFEQWATTAAPSSLLFCTEIEGRYALIPQEQSIKNSFLFTDANTIQYSEPGVSWHQSLTNTLLVKYQDNLGREKQIKICTQAVVDRLEPEIIQTISTQGVTTYAQTLRVGQVSLKSLRLQTKTCQIITDLNNGLYCVQGDIIRTQHAQIQHSNERSGIVIGVRNLSARYRQIAQTIPIVTVNDRFVLVESDIKFKVDSSGVLVDEIEISGSSTNNGVYTASSLVIVDSRSFYAPFATPIGSTPGGTLTLYRYFYDVEIQVSEPISIDVNSRITLCHRSTRVTESDRIFSDLGGGWYRVTAVEEAPVPGDAFAIGQSGSFIRFWRIASIQPDIANNKVTLSGVLWNDDIMTSDGLVAMN